MRRWPKYAGQFLLATDRDFIPSGLSRDWRGGQAMTEDDLAFWTFMVSMLCRILDRLEDARPTDPIPYTAASGRMLRSLRERLDDWRRGTTLQDFERLLPRAYYRLDAQCRLAFGEPLDAVLGHVRFAEPGRPEPASPGERASRERVARMVGDYRAP